MATGGVVDDEPSFAKVLQRSRSSMRKTSTRSNNNISDPEVPSTFEVESSSQQVARPSRASIRVKWRETASTTVVEDEDDNNQFALQPMLSEQEQDEEGRRLPSMTPGGQGMPHSPQNNGLLEGDSVDIRVIVTGMHRVGKTSLTECLTQIDRQSFNPPRDLLRSQRRYPGVPYHTAVVTPRTCCYVTFFDSPILTSWPTDQLAEWDTFQFPFISTAHALIIVFDLTWPESFDYIKRVKAAIITAAERQSVIHCPPIYVVGNKADAVRAKTLPRREDLETLVSKAWMRELEVTTCDNIHYIEVSAATGWKVHELLTTLVLNHLEQHMSLGEAASATHLRQKQRQMRRQAKLDRRTRRRRRRQSTTTQSCFTQ